MTSNNWKFLILEYYTRQTGRCATLLSKDFGAPQLTTNWMFQNGYGLLMYWRKVVDTGKSGLWYV